MATLIAFIDHILFDVCTQGKGRYGDLRQLRTRIRPPSARIRKRLRADVPRRVAHLSDREIDAALDRLRLANDPVVPERFHAYAARWQGPVPAWELTERGRVRRAVARLLHAENLYLQSRRLSAYLDGLEDGVASRTSRSELEAIHDPSPDNPVSLLSVTEVADHFGVLPEEVRVQLARDRDRVLAEVSQDDLLELFPELDLDEGIELGDIDRMPP